MLSRVKSQLSKIRLFSLTHLLKPTSYFRKWTVTCLGGGGVRLKAGVETGKKVTCINWMASKCIKKENLYEWAKKFLSQICENQLET